jgi:hypothetical protein
MANIDLIHALAATAELCGTSLTQAAAEMLLDDLSSYDPKSVIAALSRCRRELKGRLNLADIIARIDDGRPGAEEAWAALPHDEATSVVWTDEMSQAWGVCSGLIANGDMVAARMAFRETYQRLVTDARNERRPAKWTVSLGHDVQGRKSALLMAVAKRRITAHYACSLLPTFEEEDSPVPLLGNGKKAGVIGPVHALAHFSEKD